MTTASRKLLGSRKRTATAGLRPWRNNPPRPSPNPFGESAKRSSAKHRRGRRRRLGGAVASVSDATEPRQTAPVCRVGSEDEERSLRRDERRAGRRCGVRLGRHRDEADCPSLPSGEGRGLVTPLSPYSPPSPIKSGLTHLSK